MKVMWMVAKQGHRCVVEFVPKMTMIGTAIMKNRGKPAPIVMLSYDLQSLQKFLPLGRYLEEFKLVPEVYIWKRMSKNPELVVVFRVPNASRELLAHVSGKTMLELFEAVGDVETCELIVLSEGNGGGDMTRTFMRLFHQQGSAIVSLVEEDRERITFRTEDVSPQIASYEVQTIGTERPKLFD